MERRCWDVHPVPKRTTASSGSTNRPPLHKNYRAEVEALVHAANIIISTSDPDAQIVFVTDALSVLEAVNSSKLPRLEDALKTSRCTRAVLQWIPSHCGIQGNEEADRIAKLGAGEEQQENKVTHTEMKIIIKSLFRTPQPQTGQTRLSRSEQVVIFRLRTGHNQLNQHMHNTFHLVPSPMCPCGEVEQTAQHILQDCRNHRLLREEIWPTPAPLLNTYPSGQQHGHVSVAVPLC